MCVERVDFKIEIRYYLMRTPRTHTHRYAARIQRIEREQTEWNATKLKVICMQNSMDFVFFFSTFSWMKCGDVVTIWILSVRKLNWFRLFVFAKNSVLPYLNLFISNIDVFKTHYIQRSETHTRTLKHIVNWKRNQMRSFTAIDISKIFTLQEIVFQHIPYHCFVIYSFAEMHNIGDIDNNKYKSKQPTPHKIHRTTRKQNQFEVSIYLSFVWF